ncbi:DUF6514 family protein [Anaerotignum sp.]
MICNMGGAWHVDKIELYTKQVITEESSVYYLKYILLIHSGEQGRSYGIAIEQTDAAGNLEREQMIGLCENREDTEQFLFRLAEGTAFPVELTALCDDFIFEREWKREQMSEQTAS